MGNQNTSGIVEEEKAVDKAQGVSPPEHVNQENAVEEDSNDKSPPSEGRACEDKVIEDQMDAVMDISTNGSDSMLSHEEQEQPCTLNKLNNLDSKRTSHEAADANLEVDFHEEEKEEDGFSLGDMPSVEGALLEEQSTTNDAPRIGLLDSSTTQNEHENEFLNLDHELGLADTNHTNCVDHEQEPMLHELGHDDANHTSRVDQDPPSDFLIGSTIDPTDKIEFGFKAKGDNLLDDAEEQEDNKPLNQDILEKAIHWESEEVGHETQSETTKNCVVEMQSAQEIDTQTLPGAKNSVEIESKARALDSNPGHVVGVAKNELRKSPSFDFGISFDNRSEDSDQTPLLYLDKPPRRSLSSCSSLKFQHKTIHAEYVKKPLQLQDEAVTTQVEEKTIQMERSNSQAITTIQENPIKASPSREDEAEKSPKGRRKSRSSLFTTCLCCTAAIS